VFVVIAHLLRSRRLVGITVEPHPPVTFLPVIFAQVEAKAIELGERAALRTRDHGFDVSCKGLLELGTKLRKQL